MRFMKLVLILVLLFWTLAVPKKTYAYLDPGSGSYMLQIVVGFILGGVVGLKLFWTKIKTFIKGIFTRFFQK